MFDQSIPQDLSVEGLPIVKGEQTLEEKPAADDKADGKQDSKAAKDKSKSKDKKKRAKSKKKAKKKKRDKEAEMKEAIKIYDEKDLEEME